MDVFNGGKRLRALREAREMTQPDLARASGLVQQKISRLEQGLIEAPSMEDLIKIGRVFGLDPNEVAQLYEI